MNMAKANYIRPIDFKNGRVDMNHGAGGRASAQLIEELFARAFDNEYLQQGDDAALLPVPAGHRLVMATDGHVISPLFFPGGDIGCLAVHGTLNDVAMLGAAPLYLSASFILEEGFPLAELERIVESMAAAAREAGVPVVTGDTKVVEHHAGDGIYINTAGIGVIPDGVTIRPDRAEPGDVVIISGDIGLHGVAVMSVREGLEFGSSIVSDTAPLHELVADMLATGADIRVLRDPTRGGVSTTLNEIARASGVGISLEERSLPIPLEVRDACGLLGLDPMQVANEGKLVAVVPADRADEILEAMHRHPLGVGARRIGECVTDHPRMVVARTALGGTRVVDLPIGEQLPRIC